MSIIELATHTLEITDKSQNLFHHIYEDIQSLNNILTDDREGVKDLLLSIRTFADTGMRLQLDPKSRDNLIEEKSRFEMNYKKNNAQKWRKRLQRQGVLPAPNHRLTKPLTQKEIEIEEQLKIQWHEAETATPDLDLLSEPEPNGQDHEPVPDQQPEDWERYEHIGLKKKES
jgi:hypothetical protein